MMFGKRTPYRGVITDDAAARVLEGLERWRPRDEKGIALCVHVSSHLPFYGVVDAMTTLTMCVSANRLPI